MLKQADFNRYGQSYRVVSGSELVTARCRLSVMARGWRGKSDGAAIVAKEVRLAQGAAVCALSGTAPGRAALAQTTKPSRFRPSQCLRATSMRAAIWPAAQANFTRLQSALYRPPASCSMDRTCIRRPADFEGRALLAITLVSPRHWRGARVLFQAMVGRGTEPA